MSRLPVRAVDRVKINPKTMNQQDARAHLDIMMRKCKQHRRDFMAAVEDVEKSIKDEFSETGLYVGFMYDIAREMFRCEVKVQKLWAACGKGYKAQEYDNYEQELSEYLNIWVALWEKVARKMLKNNRDLAVKEGIVDDNGILPIAGSEQNLKLSYLYEQAKLYSRPPPDLKELKAAVDTWLASNKNELVNLMMKTASQDIVKHDITTEHAANEGLVGAKGVVKENNQTAEQVITEDVLEEEKNTDKPLGKEKIKVQTAKPAREIDFFYETEISVIPLMYGDLKHMVLPDGPLDLHVVDITSLHHGIVAGYEHTDIHSEYIFNVLSQKMEIYFQSEIGRRAHMPRVGELCFVKFPYMSGLRAFRTGKLSTSNGLSVHVCYIDYGHSEYVPVTNLRMMQEEFVRGVRCSVAYFSIKDFPKQVNNEILKKTKKFLLRENDELGLKVTRCVQEQPGFFNVEVPKLIEILTK